MSPSVYIATSLFNVERAREFIEKFRKQDISISYDWTTHGQATIEQDLVTYGKLEEDAVLKADLLFMIQPARNGSHVEFGLARGFYRCTGIPKPIIILDEIGAEAKTFYYLQGVYRFTNQDIAFAAALAILNKLRINQ